MIRIMIDIMNTTFQLKKMTINLSLQSKQIHEEKMQKRTLILNPELQEKLVECD